VRAISAATLPALAIAVVGLACGEPSLYVSVELPDSLAARRDRLKVALSIYAPAADSAIDCEQIAYGDVTTRDLRSARVFHKILLPVDEEEPAIARVEREGAKIALALGAFSEDFEGDELELEDAALAGCSELGKINKDRRLTIATEETVAVRLVRERVFLSAELGGDSAAPVTVYSVDEEGVAKREPGLPLRVAPAFSSGASATATLRLSVTDGAGGQSSETISVEAEASPALEVAAAGIFEVALRARWQHGAAPGPLSGLAWRVLLDSDDDVLLSGLLSDDIEHTLHWHGVGPGGMIDQLTPAVAGIGIARAVNGPTRQIDFDVVALAPTAEVGTFSLVQQGDTFLADELVPLGFLEVEFEGRPHRAIAIGAPPILDVPAIGPVPGRIWVSDGATRLAGFAVSPGLLPDPPPNPLPTFFEALPPLAPVGACDGRWPEVASSPVMIGLRRHDADPRSPMTKLAFVDGDQVEELDLVAGQIFESLSLAALGSGVCLSVDGALHRVVDLHMNVFDLRFFIDLGPNGASGIADFGAARHRVNLPGVLRSARISTLAVDGERLALAPVVHNDELELNSYAGTRACLPSETDPCLHLVYRETLLTTPVLRKPDVIAVAPGRLLRSETFSVALMMVQLRERSEDTVANMAELYLIPRDGSSPAVGALFPCAAACTMHVADIDADGIDELLLATTEKVGGVRNPRVRVTRLSPLP